MTRLKTEDIYDIGGTMEAFDEDLRTVTGHTLGGIAAHSVQLPPDRVKLENCRVGIIPMTCGQGVIGTFAQSVAAIVSFLGAQATVTTFTDVAGIAQAVESGADVLMLADDLRFIALNLHNGRLAENGECTGKGFAAALDLMVKGVANREVLVLGAGPVGISGAVALAAYGADITVNDINLAAARRLVKVVADRTGRQVKIESNLNVAMQSHSLVFDATPCGNIIHPRHFKNETYMVIPGVPPGPTEESMALLEGKVVHNPLQLGVATMLFEVLGG